jgi:hypothetical protein
MATTAMTAAVEKAAQRIERYRRRDPDAVRLARLASLAVRIQPHLLRRLRLEFLPEVDVGTEADVWFGPLVESRGAEAIVLDPHATDLLREDLAAEPELLREVRRVTDEAHRKAPPTLRLEEEVNGLALLNDGDVVGAINEALRPAIRAVYEGGDRAMEIAHWVRRALPRLHRRVRRSQGAMALLLASDSLLGSRAVTKTPDADVSAETLAWILSPAALSTRVRLGVELLQRGLRFVVPASDSPAIELPRTDPPLLELEWTRGGRRVNKLVEAEAGRTVDLEGEVSEVVVHTLAGDDYVIERVEAEDIVEPSAADARAQTALDYFDHDVFVSYANIDNATLEEGRPGWVANLQRALNVRMGQLLGKQPRIWYDPKLHGNDVFADSLIDRLPKSAVFVSVLSPRYVKSEWCQRELEEFLKASAARGGVRVGDSSRLFKVVKVPVPLEQQPRALQATLGYEFFSIDHDSGRVREFDSIFGEKAQRDFWLKLDDLAHDIVSVLDTLAGQDRIWPSWPRASNGAISQHEEQSALRSIYLMCEEHDLEAVRSLTEFLVDRCQIKLPLFDAEETQIRESHEENLIACDAAVIYYGAATEAWVRRKLRELQKSAGYGRLKPWLAKAVYVAPPATPAKERFRTHDAVVIRGGETVSEQPLRPFLELLDEQDP